MPDEDQDRSRPNLEPPSLFGRKKRAEPEVDDDEDAAADLPPVSDPTWMFEPAPEDEVDPEPEPEPSAVVLPPEVGAPLFVDEIDEAEPEPEPDVEPEPAPPEPRRARREPRSKRLQAPKRAKTAKPAKPARVSAPTMPTVAGWVAAAVTGAVIGLLLVGTTAGSLQACEAVRGTSTCGGWGVPILLVIMAVLIAIGGFLLRLFHVPDPVSTSFLAVGMVAVIALLFLLDFLLSVWMLLVIPVIAMAMYLLAYWVTTAFVEPAKEPADF